MQRELARYHQLLCHPGLEPLRAATVLALNNAYYQVREEEAQAFFDLFRAEHDAGQADELPAALLPFCAALSVLARRVVPGAAGYPAALHPKRIARRKNGFEPAWSGPLRILLVDSFLLRQSRKASSDWHLPPLRMVAPGTGTAGRGGGASVAAIGEGPLGPGSETISRAHVPGGRRGAAAHQPGTAA